ncbi:helix-turn-helix transcriptional regulator [Natronomonas aquatica]|nr:helix-turn-helix transcriptional regulator [Natronomonas aquatica]
MKSPTEIGTGTESESISVETLREELQGIDDSPEPGTAVSETVSEVETSLFGAEQFSYDEDHIKSSLDELLVSLIALRDSDTHGKQLLDDLAEEFDTMLSPGTVYPRLHELCESGLLDQRELVKTKEYVLDDPEDTRSKVAAAARQHLALGMVFRAALEEGDFE